MALVQVVLVASLNLVDPLTTMFIVLNPHDTVQHSTDVEQVSRYFLVTVMGQEDQALPDRWLAGDLDGYIDRMQAHLNRAEDPSGSTIPQQLAKNIFLYPERHWLRKALELPLGEEMALLISNRRILELYINYAQFAPRVYGVCAASWYYFGHSSRTLSLDESAELVGLLPSPLHVHRAAAGGMEFDGDRNGNATADEGETGFISAKGYWHARARKHQWFENMGGTDESGRFVATELLGIAGRAGDFPETEDPCRQMPEGVRELIENGG